MKVLDLKVGYTCNNDCIHCVIADKKQRLVDAGQPTDLTTEQILTIIDDTYKAGIESVVFTGGEVSIRKDFESILRRAMHWGLSINIQTNGRRIVGKELSKLFIRYPRISFTIAIHGDEPKLHDKVTRRSGSLKQTLASIDTLVAMKKPISAKVVISRLNISRLTEIMETLESHGVTTACFAFPHGMGNALINFDQVIPSYTEVRPEIDRLIQMTERFGISLTLEAFPLCVVGDKYLHVAELFDSPQSEVCYLQVGETMRDWMDDRRTIKAKFLQCSECVLDAICEGPWDEYPIIYGESEFQPITFEKEVVEDLIIQIALIRNGHHPRQRQINTQT